MINRRAVDWLEDEHPHYSARRLLSARQRRTVAAAVAAGAALTLAFHHGVAVVALTAVNAVYLLAVAARLLVACRTADATALVEVSDADARSFPSERLPVYTVLLPAFREPGIVHQLLRGVGQIDYPPERLDVIVLLESGDSATRAAIEAETLPDFVTVVVVAPGGPQTKPKACNVGLLQARGEFVTIYDAEDIPDPLQLRRAVVGFSRADPTLVCLQARLTYYNRRQNLLTRWFALEYALWFTRVLPGLAALRAPIPLGGTSNHVRTDVLRRVGAWDPFNVTEDAELGVRLYCEGHRCAVLRSDTAEEANSDFVNWVRQRSRWYKGYLQTGVVHARHPQRLARGPGGLRGSALFFLMVPGTPLLALFNLGSWALAAAWWLGGPPQVTDLFPSYLYYLSGATAIAGNLAMVYLHVATAVSTGDDDLVLAALGVPLYWLMMAIAACKGTFQLIAAPSYWEKTVHGLDHDPDSPG